MAYGGDGGGALDSELDYRGQGRDHGYREVDPIPELGDLRLVPLSGGCSEATEASMDLMPAADMDTLSREIEKER